MKKIRIVLSTIAVLFAFGGTFAMNYSVKPLITGYEFIPASGSNPKQCIQRQVDCQQEGTNPCVLNTHDVKDANNQATCGNMLKRP